MVEKPTYDGFQQPANDYFHDTDSTPASPQKPKFDRMAVAVFFVALAVLLVLCSFVVREAERFLYESNHPRVKRLVTAEREKITGGLRFGPSWSGQGEKSLHRIKLPSSITNEQLGEFVKKKNHIRILYMPDCREITDISPLSKLSHLAELNIDGCTNIKSIEPLSDLKGLMQIKMSRCSSVTDLSPLLNLTSLTVISMPSTITNEQLALVLPRLSNLESLGLRGCNHITDISPVSRLPNLKRLYISGCRELRDISPLSEVSGLRHLALTSSAVSDLSPLAGLPNLISLMLGGSTTLKDISPLAGIKNLRALSLNGSQGIRDIRPLAELRNLTRLGLSNLRELSDISPLYGLKGLRYLEVVNCKKLTNLQFNELKRFLPDCEIRS